MTVTAPADIPADIRDRHRRGQSPDQLVQVGERTGWWTSDDVDRALDDGPRLAELEEELADRHVIEPAAAEPDQAESAAPAAGGLGPPAAARPDDVVVQLSPGVELTDEPIGEVASSAYVAVLQARDLGVDHSYQRPLDEARVARMVDGWDPRMVGTLDVSDRGPDEAPRYAVVNGQHRAAAAARVSPAGGDVWLACTVHEGLSVADEARLMHELDRTTKKLSGWDKWRARRGAGDPAVLEVDRIAARHGLRVNDAIGDGALRSYGTAEKLLQRGGEQLLDTSLTVLKGAYGDSASAFQAPLLMGVGQLLQAYGATVDVDRLTRALASTRPEQLRQSATALREIAGGSLHELMTRAIAGQYNRTPGPGPRLGGRS